MANEFLRELLTRNGFTDLDWIDEIANDVSYREEFSKSPYIISDTLYQRIVGKMLMLLKTVIKNGGTKEDCNLAARLLLAAIDVKKYKLNGKDITHAAVPLYEKYGRFYV